MSGFARIDSVDSLRQFRAVLVKFAEHAQVALGDAEGEMARVLVWLETEASTYWSGQIRKRHDPVEKCKEAVRQKKLFKSPTGNTQSAVEEEKELRAAMKKEEEAMEKLKNVRRYIPRLQKEISIYKGGVQRLTTTVSADIPLAISRLDKMAQALDAYAALTVSGGGGDDGFRGAFSADGRAHGGGGSRSESRLQAASPEDRGGGSQGGGAGGRTAGGLERRNGKRKGAGAFRQVRFRQETPLPLRRRYWWKMGRGRARRFTWSAPRPRTATAAGISAGQTAGRRRQRRCRCALGELLQSRPGP